MIVYFDTNVVRNLAQRRKPYDESHVDIVRKQSEGGKLNVAPSFEVLYEILSAPDTTDTIRFQNAQFYVGIADWKCALKPANQMLEDDIKSCFRQKGPSTPYRAIDSVQSGFIKEIRGGKNILPNTEWCKVIRKSRSQNKRFVEKLFNEFVVRLPDKGKAKLKGSPEATWQSWWGSGGLAELIACCLAKQSSIEVGSVLLSLPSVRGAIGYILHTWRSQIVSGHLPKPTAHYDFRNAVMGAAVGRMVTDDKKLREAMKHIPKLKVTTWTLCEFTDSLAAVK